MSNSDTTYSGKQAANIVGITYRQLDYWARTDLIQPAVVAAGSGSRRQYSYEDLLRLKVVKVLLDSGISLEKVRKVFENVQGFGADVKDANLILDGEEVFFSDRDNLVSLIHDGQIGMFTLVSVQHVQGELDASIVDLQEAKEEATSLLSQAPQQQVL